MVTVAVQTDVEYFESVYREAGGDRTRVPWADEAPKSALLNWLNAVAPSIVRCGARVAVVGCGTGEDARAVIQRGYEVTAFDCSKSAIDWARRLDPDNARCYYVADLFNPPARWKHRFDLVVEINTIQSLAPELHAGAMKSIAELMSPHGHLLVICRGADEQVSVQDGPPWALTREELLALTKSAGLKPVEPIALFNDDEDSNALQIRGLFKRD